MSEDVRRRVIVTYRRLDQLDHYQLLGVARSSDDAALKRAYFELAARFHPDRYFRKKLGSFKPRMVAIFGRLTAAHDTLRNAAKRAEYDEYLAQRRKSKSIEELLAAALAETQQAAESIEREAARGSYPVPVPPPAGGARQSAPPPAPPPSRPSMRPSSPDVNMAARREAFAARLLGGGRRSVPPPSLAGAAGSDAKSASSNVSTGEAMDALRRRYEDRKAQAKAATVRRYVTNAEAATAAGDFVAAANALRVAVGVAPEDADLQAKAQAAQDRADEILADTYTRQAGYEEKSGNWAEAARSWMRVCKARPKDAKAHRHAANSLLKSGADLHEAARLAQQACTIEPESPLARVLLGNVYLAAGLMKNARRELETAAQLAPHDGTIQALLKRVDKSG